MFFVLFDFIYFFLPALLWVIRETENDDLTGVMQKLIYTYGEDIIPIAVEITQHLVSVLSIPECSNYIAKEEKMNSENF